MLLSEDILGFSYSMDDMEEVKPTPHLNLDGLIEERCFRPKDGNLYRACCTSRTPPSTNDDTGHKKKQLLHFCMIVAVFGLSLDSPVLHLT